MTAEYETGAGTERVGITEVARLAGVSTGIGGAGLDRPDHEP
jgi:hypothetical protein